MRSKSFGQIFLKSNRYIERIIDSMDINNEVVVEIGSGDGNITERLLKKVAFLYAVEIDSYFVDILRRRFKDDKNIEIIHSDILKFPIKKLNKKLIIFGNPPYQISSKLLNYLISNREFIKIAYLTFQKEFAERLLAGVSNKKYSSLTCYFNYYGVAKKILDIPKEVFFPKPKVDSTFISIEFYKDLPYKAKKEDFLFEIINRAFSNRRKKIINSLPILKRKKDLLLELNLNEFMRPEDLSIKDYVSLANRLYYLENLN